MNTLQEKNSHLPKGPFFELLDATANLKGQSSEILIPFLDKYGKTKHEYEPLLFITFFRSSTILEQRQVSSRCLGETLLERLIFMNLLAAHAFGTI